MGRVEHRDHSMFMRFGTTGRLVRGVRVGVPPDAANNSSFAQFCPPAPHPNSGSLLAPPRIKIFSALLRHLVRHSAPDEGGSASDDGGFHLLPAFSTFFHLRHPSTVPRNRTKPNRDEPNLSVFDSTIQPFNRSTRPIPLFHPFTSQPAGPTRTKSDP